MFNQFIMVGRLCRDPELRHTQTGKAVVNVTIATNPTKDESLFMDCSFWDKSAESLQAHVKKGQAILVVGQLRTESWEKEGVKQTKTKMTVQRWEFLPSGGVPNASAP